MKTKYTYQKEEEFFHNDIRIDYRIVPKNSNECILETSFSGDICMLDLIQNESDDFGRGKAGESLKLFFQFLAKELKIYNIYSFASYDEDYYCENDKEISTKEGIGRLVSFYQRNGFDILGYVEDNESQVDMSMQLSPNGIPLNLKQRENIVSALEDVKTPILANYSP